MINRILNYLKQKRKNAIFHKQATIIGTGHIFGLRAGISLLCNSTKKDVLIDNNSAIFGNLVSEYHGKIYIGKYVYMGAGCKILSINNIHIGDYTWVADNTTICDNNNHPVNPDFRMYASTTSLNDDSRTWKHSDNAPIIIGKKCWIGTNVRIQKGVTIGDNSIIAACSVVTKSVPANCIAAGNPAKIVKTDIDKIPAPTSCKGYNEWRKKQ